ncbi:MAG: PolC-type DNA polymerase III [Clostridium sp.]|nr:PolC-type DNA polymerase III [Clostridium sp.]
MKPFLDVFPMLKISDSLRGLLKMVEVDRISTSRDHSVLRIYIESTRLIRHQNIVKIEKSIREQCFPNKEIEIHIIEKYRLSEQYTAEHLMEVYRDSILYELKNYSILLYTMFRRANLTFREGRNLDLNLEDGSIARDKVTELVRILEKTFNERCGVPIAIDVSWREPETRQEQERKAYVLPISGTRYDASAENAAGADYPMAAEGAQSALATGANGSASAGGASSGKDGLKKIGFDPAAKKREPKAADRKNAEKKTAAAAASSSSSVITAPAGGGASGNGERKSADGDRGGFSGSNRGQKGNWSKGGFRGGRRGYFKSENPDVLYGRDFDGETVPIHDLEGRVGDIILHGQILGTESREIREGTTLFIFKITDFNDSIQVKIFAHEDSLDDVKAATKPGQFVIIRGVANIDKFDGELAIGNVSGIKKGSDFRVPRVDNSPIKRVELHLHTKMSDMDGVSDIKDIIKQAKSWGWDALAVTDHGCVQSFPDANHSVDRGENFKILYGVEGYLVNDIQELVQNGRGQSLDTSCVVFDIETTGFSPIYNRIIEIGAVKVENGRITDRFSTFVNPQVPIPYHIEQLTSINDGMVMDAPPIEEVLPKFLEFCGDSVIVAHNASFDTNFIRTNCERMGLPYDPTILDTVTLARLLLPNLNRFKLDTVARELKISLENHHRAVDDAGCTAEIFVKFIAMLKDRGVSDLTELNALSEMSAEIIQKMPTYHIILLAKNDLGRINLYRLISESYLTYYHRQPRIPKSLLAKYREGIIIGSACEAGELFQAVVRGVPDSELGKIVSFYDYLEIQPIGNNEFMLRDESSSYKTVEDLQNLNRKIVSLGEQFNKPVCATCDVHFLNPEDEVYRRIIQYSKGFKDADMQAPLYLRTTEEMLEEFEYLGSDKAQEVVITNTRKIAAMCERIEPVRPDKRPPIIEDSDQTLRTICYNKAHEWYGDPLPEIVVKRLETELNSIISNGYAVMYIIAQKLVWKANEDGYLVGSRGSVGSSFVATMSGITEVNPLSPHYRCPKCHYVDFDSEEVKKFAGMAGCDMPDKACPNCGENLIKDGYDIPFETFLGFSGDKEPDIDLNFSGEYQSRAHAYTEVIFGKGQTFRAGTIGTLADKTAFGMVLHYCEEKGIHHRRCEEERIASGMVGVRRTTGQHPGGIIVLPVGEQIYSFTPVQHPAEDMTSRTITTHFDYHSIDHNLLKLDILGHDDPTMIRFLQDLTGEDPTTFPLDSRKVMSLFQDTSALGITPDDIGGTQLGCLGLPEFGTDFAMQMLIDTKPQYFSDLVRIAGLAHGTDVWLGNAETLIKQGTCTIGTAICCRDDIMVYLMQQGVEPAHAFKIMENVRKGKVAAGKVKEWQGWVDEMKEHGVPDWYIWSCKKIKYMFPKAHAAAYVMMAWRIAYCKVYYPLAFYAAWFSIRAQAFSYELMCMGPDKLKYHLDDYRKRADSLSNKEEGELHDMRLVEEMYARGFEFMPIDIYRADSRHFQIIDGKLMPSLGSIEGLGEKAADAIMFAAEEGPFLSKEDFIRRTKVSKTVADKMQNLGLLEGLPESNQLSLFDML